MRYTLTIFATTLAFYSLGCESESGGSMQERQDNALKDPFNYGPSGPTTPTNRTTPPAKPNRDNSTQGQAERFKNP